MITLSDPEQLLATYVARKRYEYNRNTGTKNNKLGPQTDEFTDKEGIAAEIAFCKMMNLYPDLSTENRPPHDAILKDGTTVDVKATKYRNGHLLATDSKGNSRSDIYVLMVGEFPT